MLVGGATAVARAEPTGTDSGAEVDGTARSACVSLAAGAADGAGDAKGRGTEDTAGVCRAGTPGSTWAACGSAATGAAGRGWAVGVRGDAAAAGARGAG